MRTHLQPVVLNRQGNRLLIDVFGAVGREELAAIEAACDEGCTEAVINFSQLTNLSLATVGAIADAVPLHVSVVFSAMPPGVMQRLGRNLLESFGRVLED